jgi:hypothetical protein
MEEIDIDIIDGDGLNRLIHGTFVVMDEDAPMDDIYDNIQDDVPLIKKAQKSLYKDSSRILLFAIFWLVNLKVLILGCYIQLSID